MNIIDKMSRTNYEAFIALITDPNGNGINDNWIIKLKDHADNYLNNISSNSIAGSISIYDILLSSPEVTITHTFQNNDCIIVCKSFGEYRISYQGSGKYLNVYESLIDEIAEGSKNITSTRLNARSTYKYLSSSE